MEPWKLGWIYLHIFHQKLPVNFFSEAKILLGLPSVLYATECGEFLLEQKG